MTQPSQSALSKQSYILGRPARDRTSALVTLSSQHVQDMADASQVECVEPTLLPGICSPCLAAIQQCADNTGNVDRHIWPFVFLRLMVSPKSLQACEKQSTNDWSSSWVWVATAASSANSMSLMRTSHTFVLALRWARLKSLPSERVRR